MLILLQKHHLQVAGVIAALATTVARTRHELTSHATFINHKSLFTVVDMVIPGHACALQHCFTSLTLFQVQFFCGWCGGDRRSVDRRSLNWLGRRHRACLAPRAPRPVSPRYRQIEIKYARCKHGTWRKNRSRCLQAARVTLTWHSRDYSIEICGIRSLNGGWKSKVTGEWVSFILWKPTGIWEE